MFLLMMTPLSVMMMTVGHVHNLCGRVQEMIFPIYTRLLGTPASMLKPQTSQQQISTNCICYLHSHSLGDNVPRSAISVNSLCRCLAVATRHCSAGTSRSVGVRLISAVSRWCAGFTALGDTKCRWCHGSTDICSSVMFSCKQFNWRVLLNIMALRQWRQKYFTYFYILMCHQETTHSLTH